MTSKLISQNRGQTFPLNSVKFRPLYNYSSGWESGNSNRVVVEKSLHLGPDEVRADGRSLFSRLLCSKQPVTPSVRYSPCTKRSAPVPHDVSDQTSCVYFDLGVL